MVYVIAAVLEPGFGIVAANPVDGRLHGFFQGLPGTGLGLAQLGFELTPCLFDGRKIRRIRRQKQQLNAAPDQLFAHAGQVMDAQIVEYEHIAAAQLRGQEVHQIECEAALIQDPVQQLQPANA